LWHTLNGLVVSLVSKKKHFNAARLLGESVREQKGEGEEELHGMGLRVVEWWRGLGVERFRGLGMERFRGGEV
jgi:hypothetical protein